MAMKISEKLLESLIYLLALFIMNVMGTTHQKINENDHNCLESIPLAIRNAAIRVSYFGPHQPTYSERLDSLRYLKKVSKKLYLLRNCEFKVLADLLMIPIPFASEIFVALRHAYCSQILGPELGRQSFQHECLTFPQNHLPVIIAEAYEDRIQSFPGSKSFSKEILEKYVQLDGIWAWPPIKFWRLGSKLQEAILKKLTILDIKDIYYKWFWAAVKWKWLAITSALLGLVAKEPLYLTKLCQKIIIRARSISSRQGDWIVKKSTGPLFVFPLIIGYIHQVVLNEKWNKEDLLEERHIQEAWNTFSKNNRLPISSTTRNATTLEIDNVSLTLERVQLDSKSSDSCLGKFVEEDLFLKDGEETKNSGVLYGKNDFASLVNYAIYFFTYRQDAVPILRAWKAAPVGALLTAFDFACAIIGYGRTMPMQLKRTITLCRYIASFFSTPYELAVNLWKYSCRHLLKLFLWIPSSPLQDQKIFQVIFEYYPKPDMLTFATLLYHAPNLVCNVPLLDPYLDTIFQLRTTIPTRLSSPFRHKSNPDDKIVLKVPPIVERMTAIQRRDFLRIFLLFASGINLDVTARKLCHDWNLPLDRMKEELQLMTWIANEKYNLTIDIIIEN